MKLNVFTFDDKPLTELPKSQQDRFIVYLEKYQKENKDIVHGIEIALTLLGYEIIDN